MNENLLPKTEPTRIVLVLPYGTIIRYEVTWWDGGKRSVEWLDEIEVSASTGTRDRIGFRMAVAESVDECYEPHVVEPLPSASFRAKITKSYVAPVYPIEDDTVQEKSMGPSEGAQC